jgi:hypothetical protein
MISHVSLSAVVSSSPIARSDSFGPPSNDRRFYDDDDDDDDDDEYVGNEIINQDCDSDPVVLEETKHAVTATASSECAEIDASASTREVVPIPSVLEALTDNMLQGIEAAASARECVFAIHSGRTLLAVTRLGRAAHGGGGESAAGADTDMIAHVPAALAPLRRNGRICELLAQQHQQSATLRALDLEMQRRDAMSSSAAAAAKMTGRQRSLASINVADPHWLQARAFVELQVPGDEDTQVAESTDAGASSSSAGQQGSAASTHGVLGNSSSSAHENMTAPALAWLRYWAIDAVLHLVRSGASTRALLLLL